MTIDAIAVIAAIATAGLLAGILSLALNLRQGSVHGRQTDRLRNELDRSYRDCLQQIGRVAEDRETSETRAQSSLDPLPDGRLDPLRGCRLDPRRGCRLDPLPDGRLDPLPDGRLDREARARALQMVRSGMAADAAAAELGLPKSELRLLEKVAALLATRDQRSGT